MYKDKERYLKCLKINLRTSKFKKFDNVLGSKKSQIFW